jgi:hypothetical protein
VVAEVVEVWGGNALSGALLRLLLRLYVLPVATHRTRFAMAIFVWCLLFVLIRHGEEGATSLHAGLERLGMCCSRPRLQTISGRGGREESGEV